MRFIVDINRPCYESGRKVQFLEVGRRPVAERRVELGLGTGTSKSGYRSCLWVGVTLLTLGGCTEDMEVRAGHEDRMTVRDSMGVLISENFDSVGGVNWTIRAEPVLTIGQDFRAPREYQFDWIGGAIRLPDGGILVADGGNTLRAYRETGGYIATWGREGEGPGEFGLLGGLDRLGADSVVVWDRRLQRLTVFDATGRVGREVTVREAPELILRGAIGQDRLVFERVVAFEFDASEFEKILTGRSGGEDYQRQRGAVELWDATGNRVAVVGPYPHTEYHFPSRAVRFFGPVRFFRKMITGVWDSLVIAGPNDTYELHGHGIDGGVERIIRWNRAPIVADDGHRKAFADENPGRDQDAPMASHLPMFDWVVGDALGYLWVRDYDMPGEELVRWTIFDSAGAIVTRLRTSDRLRVWEIGQDYILASQTDDLGIHSVVVLSLHRG